MAAVVQLVFGLIWLVATAWVAHASILGNADDADVALSSAAAALPGVVAASVFAGACAGFAVGWRLPDRTMRVRLLLGVAAGAVLGALAAGAILYGYGANSSVAALAITVGVGAALGGTTAGLPTRVAAAGLAATSAVFLLGLLLGGLQGRLNSVFVGPDASVAARATASTSLAYAQSALSGVLAGIVAFLVLRGDRRPWPWTVAAGAAPGVLLLVAELLTRIGGSSLFTIVKSFSPFDQAVVEFTDFTRLRNGLLVLFVGAIAAMITVGRTLGRPSD